MFGFILNFGLINNDRRFSFLGTTAHQIWSFYSAIIYKRCRAKSYQAVFVHSFLFFATFSIKICLFRAQRLGQNTKKSHGSSTGAYEGYQDIIFVQFLAFRITVPTGPAVQRYVIFNLNPFEARDVGITLYSDWKGGREGGKFPSDVLTYLFNCMSD